MNTKTNIFIYEGKNGTRVELNSGDFETMWGTQQQIASIFDSSVSNISEHIASIYKTNELKEKETFRIFRNVSNQPIKHYNLDMIIAVGYRINSMKATQFRIWATKILKEYIIKGFAIDDERLKDPKANQYFDELLERIRDIRASEKLFYQKVKEIYSTAIDYDSKSEQVKEFFATVQNKLIYAITGKTAAELIVLRMNAKDKHFGCTSYKGSIVRKGDIYISKNYLNKDEIDGLNRLTTMLLEYAEDQARRKQALTMKDWEKKVESLIQFNDYPVLNSVGKISREKMERLADEQFEVFDSTRKSKERRLARKEALEDMERLEKDVRELLKKEKK